MQRTLLRLQEALSPLLAPLGWAYAAVLRRRELAYAKGGRDSWRPPVPTVSVGNIAWGGTGKTPLAAWIAQRALDAGRSPCILTRGYNAAPPGPHYLASPDNLPIHVGDEPLMLCRALPGARVVVDPDRTRAGKWAVSALKPHLFILDDGFSHLAVRRDLDLVLLTPGDLGRNWGRTIPAGPWREGPAALARASAFLVRCAEEEFPALGPLAQRRLGPLGKPVFTFTLLPQGLVPVSLRKPGSPPPPGTRYLLASATGNPASVYATATAYMGREPQKHLAFPDHHNFTSADWLKISVSARSWDAEAVLCTEKDAAKLAPFADETVWSLSVAPAFGPALIGRDDFIAWWEEQASRLFAG
ncbi:MAG: tetraacyldisaccharide 4'-kinase [Thermodesulfobacteriota bacterium]